MKLGRKRSGWVWVGFWIGICLWVLQVGLFLPGFWVFEYVLDSSSLSIIDFESITTK